MTDSPSRSSGIAPGSKAFLWRVLAYSLAAVHIAYVVFVVLGSLLVLVWPSLIWVHLAAVVWAGGTMFFDLGCFITTWEKASIQKAGLKVYDEGFLQHHVLRTRFDPAKARRNHIILGLLAIALNALIYALILGG